MTKMLLSYFFLTFAVSANAGQFYDSAKSQYSALRLSANERLAQIEAQKKADLAPVLQHIQELQQQRDRCSSFDCAKQLDAEIKKTTEELYRIGDAAGKQAIAVYKQLVAVGRPLALSAYGHELEDYLAINGLTVLSAVHGQPCAKNRRWGPPGLEDMDCQMSTIEFHSSNGSFYRTEFIYGLRNQTDQMDADGLDKVLLQSTLKTFLQPDVLRSGDSPLLNCFTNDQNYGASWDVGYSNEHHKYAFSRADQIGYMGLEVEHSP